MSVTTTRVETTTHTTEGLPVVDAAPKPFLTPFNKGGVGAPKGLKFAAGAPGGPNGGGGSKTVAVFEGAGKKLGVGGSPSELGKAFLERRAVRQEQSVSGKPLAVDVSSKKTAQVADVRMQLDRTHASDMQDVHQRLAKGDDVSEKELHDAFAASAQAHAFHDGDLSKVTLGDRMRYVKAQADVAKLTGVEPSQIDGIKISDYLKIQKNLGIKHNEQDQLSNNKIRAALNAVTDLRSNGVYDTPIGYRFVELGESVLGKKINVFHLSDGAPSIQSVAALVKGKSVDIDASMLNIAVPSMDLPQNKDSKVFNILHLNDHFLTLNGDPFAGVGGKVSVMGTVKDGNCFFDAIREKSPASARNKLGDYVVNNLAEYKNVVESYTRRNSQSV